MDKSSQACQFYVASIWLLPVSHDPMMQPPSTSANDTAQIPSMLRQISASTGAEAVFKSSNCFELHGMQAQVKAAVSHIFALDFVKVRSSFQVSSRSALTTSILNRTSTSRSGSRSNWPTSIENSFLERRMGSSARFVAIFLISDHL